MKRPLTRIVFTLLPAAIITLPIHAESPVLAPPPTVQHTQVLIPLPLDIVPATQPDLFDKPQDMKKLVDAFADRIARLEHENQLLKSEIDRLRAEDLRLRADLEMSKSKLGTGFKLAPFTLTPPPQQSPDKPGKPFQFNGSTVYIEPIALHSLDALERPFQLGKQHQYNGQPVFVEPITQGNSALIINSNKNNILLDDRAKQK